MVTIPALRQLVGGKPAAVEAIGFILINHKTLVNVMPIGFHTDKDPVRAWWADMTDRKKYNRKYYLDNKEAFAEASSKYYQVHKEEYAEYCKQYFREHREQFKKYNRKHYRKNKEKICGRIRKYNQDNKEKVALREKAYREKNKEKIALRKRIYRLKRKMKRIGEKEKEWAIRSMLTVDDALRVAKSDILNQIPIVKEGVAW